MTTPALIVDLDGTLIRGDLLHESLLILARQHPAALLRVPGWLAGGKARLKSEVAARVSPDVALLPYRAEVLEFLRAEKSAGRRIILATASHRILADRVAAHLGLFDDVLATDAGRNVRDREKLAAIREHLGDTPFEYVGDSTADLPVWEGAAVCHVAGSAAIHRQAAKLGKMGRSFPRPHGGARAVIRALRPQQWAKNLLIFVPAVLAHETKAWPALLIGFALFSLVASGIYVLNDLLDIESDRQHPRKRTRPFAAGALSVPPGLWIGLGLPLGALAGAALLDVRLAALLAGYIALSLAYSFLIKLKPVADVITLAGLYTLRLFVGATLANVELSTWVLAFSGFLFLSLAFAKRFTELLPLADQPVSSLHSRGYVGADLEMIRVFGPVSGYLAVLVFALYLESDKVRTLYSHPARLWWCTPALLYWITRLWLVAQRRVLHHDPLVFALTDAKSYVVAAWMIGAAVWATA